MKKIVALILMFGFALGASFAHAESKQLSFWEKLRKKVETFTPQKQLGATTAVGGVRGAPSDANDIYWKGEAVEEPVGAEELAAFKKAMDLATSGDVPQAQAAFEGFIKAYPNSSLRKDADQALAALK